MFDKTFSPTACRVKKHNFIKTCGSGITAAIDHLISIEFNEISIADVAMLKYVTTLPLWSAKAYSTFARHISTQCQKMFCSRCFFFRSVALKPKKMLQKFC